MTKPRQPGWRRSGIPKWPDPQQPSRVILENTYQCAGCRHRYFTEAMFVADTPHGERDFCSAECFRFFISR